MWSSSFDFGQVEDRHFLYYCSAFPSKESHNLILLSFSGKQFETRQRTGNIRKYCLVWGCQHI